MSLLCSSITTRLSDFVRRSLSRALILLIIIQTVPAGRSVPVSQIETRSIDSFATARSDFRKGQNGEEGAARSANFPGARDAIEYLDVKGHQGRPAIERAAHRLQSDPPVEPDARAALARTMPTLDGRIEGSITLVNAANVILNSPAVITSDLFVPGTPRLQLNGTPSIFNGVRAGSGSAQPSSHTVTLNSKATLRQLVTRTDPVSLPVVTSPPAPTGTRSVTLDKPGQAPGDFSTIRNLTLNSKVGSVRVPPGTYGDFIANSDSGFVLGVEGATEAAVYNFSSLQLNSKATFEVVGPVTVTVRTGRDTNASMGSESHPEWLTLRVASGNVSVNSSSTVYGAIVAPSSVVTINSHCEVVGSAVCDRLVVSSGGILRMRFGDRTPPEINLNFAL